ncbi:MAG: T9SS type A sorting domain-containing protein [Crocinitomicaceae bacterium]|nr:T9SS type A sorting domain-containing protein [Crocinitomicaceae bacterium]
MKKVLLFSAVSMSLGVTAQSITAADTLSDGMSTVYFVMDSSAATLDAVTGTGVTWNYTSLYGELGVPSNSSVIDNSVPGQFSPAEYHEDLATFASIYYLCSADSTTIYGYEFTVDAYAVEIAYYLDPLKFMTYPASVGTTINDVMSGQVDVNGGTGTGPADGTAVITVDGSGTLNVGGQSHSNIIRVKLVENISTSITIVPFPADNGTVVRTIYYYYDLANDKQPIFMHATVDISSTLINQSFNSVYYSGIPAYVSVAELNDGDFTVYPNPANDVVTITTDGTADQLTVFNLNGQVITSFINPQAIETVNVSELPAGTYLIQVTNEGVVTEEKLVVD